MVFRDGAEVAGKVIVPAAFVPGNTASSPGGFWTVENAQRVMR